MRQIRALRHVKRHHITHQQVRQCTERTVSCRRRAALTAEESWMSKSV
ncbi:hypothetical protein PI125_g19495 [Phytophthora idaei]|nr:hypothetical protein PI125_g19495 [Phytophthora idaei]